MKKFRFINDGLAGDVFYPETGSSPTSAGLFFFGFPAFIGPNEVTRALVESGLISFQPHYFGTYDSDGVFSPSSIVDTSRVSQEFFDRGFVLQTKDESRYPLPRLEICVGHSFGSLVALRSAAVLYDLRVLVLLAPTVHYRRSNPDFGNKADGPKSLESVRRSNPRTYRLASSQEWHKLMTGSEPLPISGAHPKLERVVAVVGERDSYVDIPALEGSFDLLIDSYCGPAVHRTLHVIPDGGHTMDYLVEAGEHFSLSRLLREYGLSWGSPEPLISPP